MADSILLTTTTGDGSMATRKPKQHYVETAFSADWMVIEDINAKTAKICRGIFVYYRGGRAHVFQRVSKAEFNETIRCLDGLDIKHKTFSIEVGKDHKDGPATMILVRLPRRIKRRADFAK